MQLLEATRKPRKIHDEVNWFSWIIDKSIDEFVSTPTTITSCRFQVAGHEWSVELTSTRENILARLRWLTPSPVLPGGIWTLYVGVPENPVLCRLEEDRIVKSDGITRTQPNSKLKELLAGKKEFVLALAIHIQNSKDVGPHLFCALSKLQHDQRRMDVRFVFENNRQLAAHSLILSARSPVFDAMFTNEMLENRTQEVVIVDVSIEAFSIFLSYLYMDKVTIGELEKYKYDLLMLSDKYDVPGLKITCQEFIVDGVNCSNVCDIWASIDKYNVPFAREIMLLVIKTHSSEIFQSAGFGRLMKENPAMALEIQQSLVKKDESREAKMHLLRKYYGVVLERGLFDRMSEFFTSNYVGHFGGGDYDLGKIENLVRKVHNVFHNITVQIESHHWKGDTLESTCRLQGNEKSDNSAQEWVMTSQWRFEGVKCAESWFIFSTAMDKIMKAIGQDAHGQQAAN